MNRRECVVVAAVINAGLLIVLFVSSMKTKSPYPQVAALPQEMNKTIAHAKPVLVKNDVEALKPLQKTIERQVATPASVEPKAEELPPSKPSVKETLLTKSLPNTRAVEKKKEPSKTVIITVKKGDMLEKIAKAYNVTVKDIMEVNHLKSERLQIGQQLTLPTQRKISSTIAKVANSSEHQYYTVKNGDNPSTIAFKNKLKLSELLRLNNLDEEKAKKIRPGLKLRIK